MGTSNRLKDVLPYFEREVMTKQQVRKAIAGDDLSPLDFLLAVIRDPTLAVSTRLDAARTAAPFLHQKKPLAIEGTEKPLFDPAILRGLSKEELVAFKHLMSQAGVDEGRTH